ncbi:MAG: hypothetical protein SVY10_08030 [Thermodesulfobacteriota bacterium]|nr:hypothetical protein [Thermodesulfobacteriota bacterium]
MKQAIDIYGQNGFDAISITDHVFDTKSTHSLEMIEQGASIADFSISLSSVIDICLWT